jgi:hypothetical protein
MSIGTMGVVRPADVSITDIEMYYNYTPDRYTSNNEIFKLESTELLNYCYLPDDDDGSTGGEDLLEGLYDMKLPASTFNQLGIYSIYLKAKKETSVIIDCSVLSSLPSVKGIVLDINSLPAGLTSNNALQGYRIEYINEDGTKLRNVARYIVTSNKVSVSTENVGNTTQKTQRYRFDDSGSLLFLQLTPSSASDVKPNVSPFIGNIGQTIILSNTYFTPIVLEIELVENTIDTLTQFVAGEQVKDTTKGILTYYDKDRVITRQFDLFEVKDSVTEVPLYEVKEQRSIIDTSQDFDGVTDFEEQ